MNSNPNIVFLIRICLMLALALSIAPAPSEPGPVTATPTYLDPTLAKVDEESLSIIVTAADVSSAAEAVAEAGGTVTSRLWLIDAVGARIPAANLSQLTTDATVHSIIGNRAIESAQMPVPDGSNDEGWVTPLRFPVPWDGAPDVAWGNAEELRLAYPVAVDVGASQFQGSKEAMNYPYISGWRVGIAVIDSGVYFSDETKAILGAKTAHQFIGQTDFVADGLCTRSGTKKYRKSIQQRDGYCWTDHYMSDDPYGHGSHVAGIIWNPYFDADTWALAGVAPEARILSVRVLDENGIGTYEDTIEGIQYVVENKDEHAIRIMNLSLSAQAEMPYFVDPLNRAVEAAWAAGIVVVAAAGNEGNSAQTITVPGNDPYVITVGSVSGKRTPGYWSDDQLSTWSSTGPTLDGFAKPDVLAPGAQIVSFMHNGGPKSSRTAALVNQHPDYSVEADFFRMNGTSMATAVASGVIAMMLEVYPELTPDQVKYRLMQTARPVTVQGPEGITPGYTLLQQGAGRIWAPDALLAELPFGSADTGMNIEQDLAHDFWSGWVDVNGNGLVDAAEMSPELLSPHYQGRVQRMLSDDGQAYLYYMLDSNDMLFALGVARSDTMEWLDRPTMDGMQLTWSDGYLSWPAESVESTNGGYAWGGGMALWSGGIPTWAGGMALWSTNGHSWGSGGYAWGGGGYAWGGGMALWSGGIPTWAGGMALWSTGSQAWGSGGYAWGGTMEWGNTIGLSSSYAGATSWAEDETFTTQSLVEAPRFGQMLFLPAVVAP